MLMIAVLALLQQPAAPPPPTAPKPEASPIARAVLQPAEAAVLVGDSLRLRVVAYDSAGRELTDLSVSWFATGGHFEGSVDSNGVVVGGSTGTITVTALARPRSGGRATPAFGRVTVLPQPAAKLSITPAPSRLYAGQSLALSAAAYAANDDRRYDEVTWTSDKPQIVAVTSDGRVTGKAPGQATITATAGRAIRRLGVAVVPNPVTSVALEPATVQARTGDVVKLKFVARAGARTLADAMPEWALNPGSGQVEDDGTFVADVPGTYRVFATFAGRVAEAVITVGPRDVRRPTTLVGRLPIKGQAAEFWLHPDGKHGYLTTIGDRAYAIDLSDPSKPVITDSVVVDARVINDVMTTEDGKYGVLTREGSSVRKNGIVVLSFEDPAHPKPIADFTETVTGGVHCTYIYKGYVYPHRRRHRLDAGDRHPRPLPSEAGGPLGDAARGGRADAARHRRQGRLWPISVLLERRPGHPRRRQRA